MDLERNGLLEKIHGDALRVLEEVGVKTSSQEVIRILEETGLAGYDETTGHIHVLPRLVEQALGTTPKRDQYWIPENAFGVGGTAPFVHDDETGELLEPTFAHLARIARIVDQAESVQFMARGVLIRKEEVRVIDTLVENCRKPLYVAALTDAGIERASEVHEKRGNLTIQFSIINSPLCVIESMIDPFLACVRKGLPLYVSTMPMAGLSGPYSMSGLLTLTHAEGLFGITLAQLVNPVVRGWTNYYGRYYRSQWKQVLRHLDRALVAWACWKYRRFRRRERAATHWLGRIARRDPNLFAHWQLGIRPAAGTGGAG